jgi:hypothetical protein
VGKVRPGRDADPSLRSSAEIKNKAIPLLSLRAFVAYESVKRTYTVILRILFASFPVSSVCVTECKRRKKQRAGKLLYKPAILLSSNVAFRL